MQPYLRKCFSGIHRLRFTDDFDIIGIASDFGEEFDLNEIVNTSSRRGHVEQWLADLETTMKNSVKEVIIYGVEYEFIKRKILNTILIS